MKSRMGRKAIDRKCGLGDAGDARDGGVQSVDRALLIIETLAEDDDGYRLTDLAVRTGLSPSTAHRSLTTLEKRRFVQFDRGGSTCTSAHKVLKWDRHSSGAVILRHRLSPICASFAIRNRQSRRCGRQSDGCPEPR